MNKNDFKIVVTKGSGPGGQNRNKVETCVTITHTPTGLQEKCEETRSKIKNQELAMKRLLDKIKQKEEKEKKEKFNEQRNKVIEEAGRVRTYNEQRNEVVDHRTGKKASYNDILIDGKLDLLK